MRLGRAAPSFEEEEDERLTFTRTNNVRLQQGRGGRGRGGYASLLQKVTGGTAVSVAKEGDEMVVEDSVATGEAVAQEGVTTADEHEDWLAEVRHARLSWLQRAEPLIEDSDFEDGGSSDEDEPAAGGGTAGFIAAPTFDGPRPGYSFKADAQGVGYYLEPASGGGGGGAGGGALHGAPASFVETEAEVLHTRSACSHPPTRPTVHPCIQPPTGGPLTHGIGPSFHPPLSGGRLLGRARRRRGRGALSGRRRRAAAAKFGCARARARCAHQRAALDAAAAVDAGWG